MAAAKGKKVERASFNLRLQPYKGSLLTEVVRYLQSLERSDAQRRVENVLVMALLAQARLYDEAYSDEERRRCCIEACDALDKHASMLRQLVGVAMPVRSALVMPNVGAVAMRHGMEQPERLVQRQVAVGDQVDEADEDGVRSPPPSARIDSRASAAEVNSLFGD